MATPIVNEPVQAGNPVMSIESLTPIVYRDQPVITTKSLV